MRGHSIQNHSLTLTLGYKGQRFCLGGGGINFTFCVSTRLNKPEGQDFNGQGHYIKIKGQIKVTL